MKRGYDNNQIILKRMTSNQIKDKFGSKHNKYITKD